MSALRPLLRAIAAALLVAQPVLAQENPQTQERPARPESVRDLRYGVALYDYFQGNYFQSLTELLLGEHWRDMPNHAEYAALLRGGISLSYGLDREAEQIFERLLASHPRAEVRDRAWFYLGKSHYQRGDIDGAARRLAQSGGDLPEALAQERDYLRALVALAQGQPVSVPEQAALTPWLPYTLFNIGVAQSARGDWSGATTTFTRLAALPLRDEEHKALRDRAFTAAGYTHLADGKPEQALAEFRRVRLNSPLVDKALLGYGWAALQQQDYQTALKPWQQLREKSLLLPAVQEGLLALPYAYEQLGAAGQALAEYERGERLLLAEIDRIDEALRVLATAPLLGLWLQQEERGELHEGDTWLSRQQELPVKGDSIPYLAHLLASNPVQEVIKDLRDLAVLQNYLSGWRGRLQALDSAQALQYQRRRALLADDPRPRLRQRHAELQARRETLALQLQQAQASGDGQALMSGEQLAIAARLQRVAARIEALRGAGRDMTDAEQRYQRYRGLLLWQAQADYPARRWALSKQLRELDAELNAVGRRQQQVAQLVVRAQAPEQGARIEALDTRLQQQLARIQRAQAQGEALLRSRASDELIAQRQRLRSYLGRTRLAMARLYDRGAMEALQ